MMPVAPLIVHAALLARLAAPYPFAVGETLRYDAKLGYFPVGEATVSVSRLARERGTEAFVFAATGQGGPPGWRVRYDMTSWVGKGQFNSLRFHQRLERSGKVEEHGYIILPDSARYREEGVPGDWVAPSDPLDELAFLYYLRAAPLQVGKSYSMARYFKTGYNPIQVSVTGREPVAMPDGSSAPCLAVQVTSRGTTMRVWLTDDARRLPAQLQLPLPFGVVSLQLSSLGTASK
ncbi:MAG: DUF3108 domain-containing protein [Gemmatimonadales bacterium]